MALKIEQDYNRFKQIVRGKIKKELRKFITQGELIGKQGKDFISIPLPQIDIPHFTFGNRQKGGVGQGEGKPGDSLGADPQPGDDPSQAGNLPGEHLLEVDISLEELAELLGEELELPRIEPRGQSSIVSTRSKYSSLRRSGPDSLVHRKRTYKEALKRQILAGTYHSDKPVILPIREDRRYRSWKEEKKPEFNAVIIYMMDVSGCHTAGHYIEMADGAYKDIKDIREGDEVCCIDLSTHQKRRSRVTQKFALKRSEILEVHTEDHTTLQVTPEHRYFVYDENSGQILEKRASELRKGDNLILVNQFGRGASEQQSETVLNEAQAYLTGAMLGDGHVVDHEDAFDSRKNSRYVAITDENEDRLFYYADCAATAWNLRAIIRETKEGRKRIHFNSASLVKWLKTYFPGLCVRSRHRQIDSILFRQSTEVRAAFLRGYFDAEGTLSRHAVECLSSSLALVKQLKLLLSYWGIRARIQKYRQVERKIKGCIIKEGIFYRLILNSKDVLRFRDCIGFACRVKRRKLDALCDRQRQGIDAMRSRYISSTDLPKMFSTIPSLEKIKSRLYDTGRRCFSRANLERMCKAALVPEQKEAVQEVLDRSLLLCKVKKIVKNDSQEREVYDFEVADFHNYIVDGILSHNSMGAEQKEIVRIESFWIDTWLRSQYQGLETRYIIHDAVAREVDADTFYHTRESGGTIISSAYKLALKIIEDDYDPNDWNIYAFHFSDGDNWSSNDTQECLHLLSHQMLDRLKLFGYGQVESEYGSGQFLRDLNERFEEKEERVIASRIESKEKIFDSIKAFLGKGK